MPALLGRIAKIGIALSSNQKVGVLRRSGRLTSWQAGKHLATAETAMLAADLRDFMHALELDGVTGVGTSLGCAVMWSCEFLWPWDWGVRDAGCAALAAVMTRWIVG